MIAHHYRELVAFKAVSVYCLLLYSNCLEKRTSEGNTALHYSVLHHKPESLKLLLKAKAALHTGTFSISLFVCFNLGTPSPISSFLSPTVNSAGETALDVARRLQHTQCVELVRLHFPDESLCMGSSVQRTHAVRR